MQACKMFASTRRQSGPEDIPIMIRVRELSVLQEIAYLDPELNGKVGSWEAYLPKATTWDQVRRFVSSPCVMTLGAFVALLIIGIQLAN
jgi:hypothetical protein